MIKKTTIKGYSMRNRIRISFILEPGSKKVFLKALVFLYETLPHEDGIIDSQDDSFSSCLFFNVLEKAQTMHLWRGLLEGTMACLIYPAPWKTSERFEKNTIISAIFSTRKQLRTSPIWCWLGKDIAWKDAKTARNSHFWYFDNLIF